ncbi:hypothetical protein [Streptomyces sp. S186]|uniref:hypothetical protein n=1 Tax=Streptomyces sp. S186 TaxID=3434395 RepID=UPI003F6635E8
MPGYTGGLVGFCVAAPALVLLIAKRSGDQKGFVALPMSRSRTADLTMICMDSSASCHAPVVYAVASRLCMFGRYIADGGRVDRAHQ